MPSGRGMVSVYSAAAEPTKPCKYLLQPWAISKRWHILQTNDAGSMGGFSTDDAPTVVTFFLALIKSSIQEHITEIANSLGW